MRVVDFDAADVIAPCDRLADLDDHTAHAVHTAARHDASAITPTPQLYPESVRTVMLPT